MSRLHVQSYDGNLALWSERERCFVVRLKDQDGPLTSKTDVLEVKLPRGVARDLAELCATELDLALRSTWPVVS